MPKQQKNYNEEELLLGIRTATLTLDVLNFLIKQKEKEKEWLQAQLNNLKQKQHD